MIRCNLPVLMARRRLKMVDVVNGTGISKATISALYHEKSKGVHLETIAALCKFLNCNVGDILEIEKAG